MPYSEDATNGVEAELTYSVWTRRIFYAMIIISGVIGWSVHGYYDWTGADQSYAPPVIWQTALALLAVAVLTWVALPFLPINSDWLAGSGRTRKAQFSISALLIATSVIAVSAVISRWYPEAVGTTFGGACFLFAIYTVFREPALWLPIAALICCMWLPFLWIVHYDELSILTPAIFWLGFGLPSLLPTVWVGRLFGLNPQEAMSFTMIVSGCSLLAGLWIIRLGPKRTIAYLVAVMLFSIYGSFGFNALVRA